LGGTARFPKVIASSAFVLRARPDRMIGMRCILLQAPEAALLRQTV